MHLVTLKTIQLAMWCEPELLFIIAVNSKLSLHPFNSKDIHTVLSTSALCLNVHNQELHCHIL